MKSASIPGLERGLKVIEFLAVRGEPASFSEINSILPGVNRSTLSRLLKVLMQLGYIEKSEATGLYAAGEKLGLYANAYKRGLPEALKQKYSGMMREISDKYNITCLLFVRSGNYLTSIHKTLTLNSINMQPVGNTMDINNEQPDSLWYVLLIACDPKVADSTSVKYDEQMIAFTRENGYSIDNQLHNRGIIRMHFPVFDRSGKMIGSIGAGGTPYQITEENNQLIIAEIKEKLKELGNVYHI